MLHLEEKAVEAAQLMLFFLDFYAAIASNALLLGIKRFKVSPVVHIAPQMMCHQQPKE